MSKRHYHATVDFETRSRVDLRKAGAWRYSVDPSTDALCLSYSLDSGEVKRWRRGQPPPRALIKAIQSGCIFEAHNVFFELCIWNNVMTRHGWPAIDIDKVTLVCSAARAAFACLPRALEFAVVHAGLDIRKGDDRAMKKLSKPRKPTKKDAREWINEEDDPELFEKLYEYCDGDVRAEHELSNTLKALPPFERRLFLADLRINMRGIMIDTEFVDAAIAVNTLIDMTLSAELTDITNGAVMAATERDRVIAFLEKTGLELGSIDQETVEDLLYHGTLTETQRRVLEIRQEGARSSVSKYKSFQIVVAYDAIVRGLYVYYGANAHGRFSGRLIQPQNFPRGNAKGKKGEEPGDVMERMVATIKRAAKKRDPELLRRSFNVEEHKVPGDPKSGTRLVPAPPAEVLSTALRGAFIARPGKHFGVGDYSAIEARILFWLANELYGLKIYRKGGDIYRDMGSVIFGKPPEDLDVGFERMLGKTTVLGCGYEMSWRKFQLTCKRAYGMLLPDALCEKSVYSYRDRYKAVPKFWKDLNEAAFDVIDGRGVREVRLIGFHMRKADLVITLPSGREIYHRRARIRHGQIVFVNGKGFQDSTYGGKICEYVTSGTARDVLGDAIIKAEFEYEEIDPVMHSHDELVVEGEPGRVSQIVLEIMDDMPVWTKGLPMKVEVWEGPRYHK